MKRRNFLQLTGATFAASAASTYASLAGAVPPKPNAADSKPTDAAAFAAARRFADLSFGKIAYVERGTGDAALFLHGAPLNGFQWRGAIDRLSPYRRCIAPDFMGLGYSQPLEHQSLQSNAQVEMLAALLDLLGVAKVDIIASDSGGAVAQLFSVRHSDRVRTMLLTNCDVEPTSPPVAIKPVLDMARDGTLADDTAKWLTDRALARSTFGAGVYRNAATFSDAVIDYYVKPLVSSPLRRKQYEAFHVALAPNPLAGIEPTLKRSKIPVRMVWGAKDTIFPITDAEYLDRTFPMSQGIRRVPEGKLFFQEEFPEIIAEEARRLWG